MRSAGAVFAIGILASCGALAAGDIDGYCAPEMLAALRESKSGLVDVASLDLPESFLRRIAGRSTRSLFRGKFRPFRAEGAPASAPAAPAVTGDPPAGIIVRKSEIAPERVERWKVFSDGVPSLRGFRAAAFLKEGQYWLHEPPAGADAEATRRASWLLAKGLAAAGLPRTLVTIMPQVRQLRWITPPGLNAEILRNIGVPTDLLEFFRADQAPAEIAITRWALNGAPAGAVENVLGKVKFEYGASCPGFVVMAEDGSEEIQALRFQFVADRYVLGKGDGSTIDAVCQLAAALPKTQLWISALPEQIPGAIGLLSANRPVGAAAVTIVPAPLPLSQWAQDNAKVGTVHSQEAGKPRRHATLIPRYASRNEQTSKYWAGDSLVFETLPGTIGEIVPSPLLFQGGNLMAIIDPKSRQRILLIGEAEVYRNRALGLSTDEVLGALRTEFGVDRCEVLPAISFHIDLELSVRRGPSELIACVVDELTAARVIVRTGLDALAKAKMIPEEQRVALNESLERGDVLAFSVAVGKILSKYIDKEGRLMPSLTALFSTSPAESGVVNASRFVLALDLLSAMGTSESVLADPAYSPELAKYTRSFKARIRDRLEFVEQLKKLGMRIVPVPSLSDEELTANYVNGIHLKSAYLMPSLGGFYTPLDDLAAKVLSEAFGRDVQITRIRTANMQSMFGSLHCLAAAYPDPEGSGSK